MALRRFVDAAVGRTEDLEPAREAVEAELGWPAAVDAAAVLGTFQRHDRLADATGLREEAFAAVDLGDVGPGSS